MNYKLRDVQTNNNRLGLYSPNPKRHIKNKARNLIGPELSRSTEEWSFPAWTVFSGSLSIVVSPK